MAQNSTKCSQIGYGLWLCQNYHWSVKRSHSRGSRCASNTFGESRTHTWTYKIASETAKGSFFVTKSHRCLTRKGVLLSAAKAREMPREAFLSDSWRFGCGRTKLTKKRTSEEGCDHQIQTAWDGMRMSSKLDYLCWPNSAVYGTDFTFSGGGVSYAGSTGTVTIPPGQSSWGCDRRTAKSGRLHVLRPIAAAGTAAIKFSLLLGWQTPGDGVGQPFVVLGIRQLDRSLGSLNFPTHAVSCNRFERKL